MIDDNNNLEYILFLAEHFNFIFTIARYTLLQFLLSFIS